MCWPALAPETLLDMRMARHHVISSSTSALRHDSPVSGYTIGASATNAVLFRCQCHETEAQQVPPRPTSVV